MMPSPASGGSPGLLTRVLSDVCESPPLASKINWYEGPNLFSPARSRSGNQYIMVMVEIDSNYTLVEPMKNETDEVMTVAYLALMKWLQRAGVTTTKQLLDNECSYKLKELIQDTCKLELMPPGCHCCNIAEVAIKGFKQHFLGILAGLPDDFPWLLWDRLLSQTKTTLNLLRESNAIPTVLAYAHMNGNFDYNIMPLAPMGCLCHVHVKPDNQKNMGFPYAEGVLPFHIGQPLPHA